MATCVEVAFESGLTKVHPACRRKLFLDIGKNESFSDSLNLYSRKPIFFKYAFSAKGGRFGDEKGMEKPPSFYIRAPYTKANPSRACKIFDPLQDGQCSPGNPNNAICYLICKTAYFLEEIKSGQPTSTEIGRNKGQ